MLEWCSYLESICSRYAEWWKVYTITDVVGKKSEIEKPNSPLLDLGLTVKVIKQEKEKRKGEAEKTQEREEKTERLTVLDGLRKYASDHVLLVGRPGSGKSTALARLLLEEAQKAFGNEKAKIPVLVELRYIQNSVLKLIKNFFQANNLVITLAEIESLLERKKLLLLIDGVNELPSDEARRKLAAFRKTYATTPTIFTTRDLGVGGDLNIDKKLEMQPLTEQQMRQFVRAYLPEQGEQMLKQLGRRLKEFGQTPLLLWMLCSVFANSNQIPSNLGLVFRRFTKIYNLKLKQDVPTYKESRDWWKKLLKHLAWVMTQGKSKTEIQVAISRQQAERELTEFLQGKVDYPEDCALRWLNDLLKYHLIQVRADNQIEFRHQLIQEYYTAESLLKQLSSLSNEQLKKEYLNYLKWTEPLALMLALLEEDQDQAVRVVSLALEVDWQLGARLAGEVKPERQTQTVKLVKGLKLPLLLKIKFLGQTKSEPAIGVLREALKDADDEVRRIAAESLGQIGSDTAVPGLIEALKDEDYDMRWTAARSLDKIGSDTAISALIEALKDEDSNVRWTAAESLGQIGSETAVPGLIETLKLKFPVDKSLQPMLSQASVDFLPRAYWVHIRETPSKSNAFCCTRVGWVIFSKMRLAPGK